MDVSDQNVSPEDLPLDIQQINDKYIKLSKGENYLILQPNKYDISK